MIDFTRYDRERLRRGVTDAQVARAAGLAPVTISRARHGRNRLREATFAKLAAALARFPVVIGADELLKPDPQAPPANGMSEGKKSSTARTPVELKEVVGGASPPADAPR